MTPVPESASPALPAEVAIPAGTLTDGELILLAIKPSGWFVPLASWPVAAAAVLVAAGLELTGMALRLPLRSQTILAVCGLVVLLRLAVASFQWAGRVYVLTNRRVMWIYGVARIHVFHCLLKKVTAVRPSATFGERLLGLGSLFFTMGDSPGADGWMNIAHPTQVRKMIEEAIARA